LQHQTSVGGAAARAQPVEKTAANNLQDYVVQFLVSDTEIDPNVAARDADSKKKKAKQEETVNVDLTALELLFLARRNRGLSRTQGFSYLFHILSVVSLPSVQEESLRRMPLALRGITVDETSDVAAPPAEGSSDMFHYLDGIHGCDKEITDRLQGTFQKLFTKLAVLLQTLAPLENKAGVVPTVKYNHFPLCLSVLSCWGMKFDESDHAFLDASNIIHIIRSLMEMTNASTASTAKAEVEDVKGPDGREVKVQDGAQDEDAGSSAAATVQKDNDAVSELKNAAWLTFRLLALSGFEKSSEAPASNAALLGLVQATVATVSPSKLSRFQKGLLELTLSIISNSAGTFLQEQAAAAKKEALAASKKKSKPSKGGDSQQDEDSGDSTGMVDDGDLMPVGKQVKPKKGGQSKPKKPKQGKKKNKRPVVEDDIDDDGGDEMDGADDDLGDDDAHEADIIDDDADAMDDALGDEDPDAQGPMGDEEPLGDEDGHSGHPDEVDPLHTDSAPGMAGMLAAMGMPANASWHGNACWNASWSGTAWNGNGRCHGRNASWNG